MNLPSSKTGYRLEKIFAAEQEYRVVANPPETAPDDVERKVIFGWDWRPLGPRRFEVLVSLLVEPTNDLPERANVRLLGIFSVDDGEIAPAFIDFIRLNATAILFPYARELISTLTSRGPHGSFHVSPINIHEVTKGIDLTQSSGAIFLANNPEVAADFGLLPADTFASSKDA